MPHEFPEVVFDAFLILRSGRDNIRLEDDTIAVHPVAVEEKAVRGLRAGATDSSARRNVYCGSGGRFVFGDDSQGLLASVKHFDRADDYALEGVAA